MKLGSKEGDIFSKGALRGHLHFAATGLHQSKVPQSCGRSADTWQLWGSHIALTTKAKRCWPLGQAAPLEMSRRSRRVSSGWRVEQAEKTMTHTYFNLWRHHHKWPRYLNLLLWLEVKSLPSLASYCILKSSYVYHLPDLWYAKADAFCVEGAVSLTLSKKKEERNKKKKKSFYAGILFSSHHFKDFWGA